MTKTFIYDQLHRPLLDLRISVTDRCNFRCSYCMPKKIYDHQYNFLPKSDIITYEEILRIVKLLIPLGLRKVRITGGEPFIRQDISQLLYQLSLLPDIDISITTNGSFLSQNINSLYDNGIRRINISLDSLLDSSFQKINGSNYSVGEILHNIDQAAQLGIKVKVNMVVIKDLNDKEILPMAEYFRKHYQKNVSLRFIEYMDVGNFNQWQLDKVVNAQNIFSTINNQYPLQHVELSSYGEVAQRYKYVDGMGEIGIISSVSQPFCQECTRMRLSANGQIFTCLFSSTGHDLRTLMRNGCSDQELVNSITDIWQHRDDRYSELRAKNANSKYPKVEMSFIGG